MSYDEDRKSLIKNAIEMYESLNIEVNKAGGKGYSIEELGEMTALDLLSRLCTNDIRFIWIGK